MGKTLAELATYENHGWKIVPDWKLAQYTFPLSGRTCALLKDDNDDAEVILFGEPLLQCDDNRWLIRPRNGYVQYVRGFLAEDGIITKKQTEALGDIRNYIEPDGRDKRLSTASLLLARLNDEAVASTELGKFETYRECDKCHGFKFKEVWVTSTEEKAELVRTAGLFLVLPIHGKGIGEFLSPGGGYCTCY